MTGNTVKIIYDEETDEYILPLGNDVCDAVGWQVGDTIHWRDNGDGTYTLTKKEPDAHRTEHDKRLESRKD